MLDTMAWYPPDSATRRCRQVDPRWRRAAVSRSVGRNLLSHPRRPARSPGILAAVDTAAAVEHQESWQGDARLVPRLGRRGSLEGDVLPLFTGVVGLGITAPFGTPHGSLIALPGLFLTLSLTDEAKVLQLIQKIGSHAGGPLLSAFLQRRLHAGRNHLLPE